MMEKMGVRLVKKDKAFGRTLERGEVIRFISAAVRPTKRIVATISEPRQTLPSEGPVARCTAAVVISKGSTPSSLASV
jgi:hypothetical protein